MCTPLTRRECIYSCWDATDDDMKHMIINEFRISYKGCYTQRALLNFLEKKLLETKSSDILQHPIKFSSDEKYHLSHPS